jgi:hypothetical protein
MEWLQTIVTAVVVLGGLVGSFFGGWVVTLLKAAVSELVAIKTSLKQTQTDLSDLTATVKHHGVLHERHDANFRRLGLRNTGSAGEAGEAAP